METTKKSEKNKLEKEFEEIDNENLWSSVFTQIRNESTRNNYTIEEARKSDNRFLNRYKDVNPYDHSRVILSKEGYNYINASYVNVDQINRKYILTQGPLSCTIPHFWLMIWEQKSKAIVMLNNVLEKNQVKCAQYWPDEDTREMHLESVDLKVVLISTEDCSQYVIRNFELTNLQDKETRTVIQFHYTTWPDFAVPRNPSVFLKFLRAIRQSGALEADVGPSVIHCSAGIGRSGTFCLVDSCLQLIEKEGVDSVSVRQLLIDMRKYRMGLIQTFEQLRFSYLAIIQGLKFDWNMQDNGNAPSNKDAALEDENVIESCSSDDDESVPPLPPRNESLEFEKPLPVVPADNSSTEDETESDEEIKEPEAKILEFPEGVKKRKRRDEANAEIEEKVKEMKKKLTESEEKKIKERSLLKHFGIGLGIVVISGVFLMLLYYHKSTS